MRYHLIVPPEISQAVRAFGLNREALLRLFNQLRAELESHGDNYKPLRDPVRPDLYFWFELTVWDRGRPRGFRFTVDDARATDRLFLVGVDEI